MQLLSSLVGLYGLFTAVSLVFGRLERAISRRTSVGSRTRSPADSWASNGSRQKDTDWIVANYSGKPGSLGRDMKNADYRSNPQLETGTAARAQRVALALQTSTASGNSGVEHTQGPQLAVPTSGALTGGIVTALQLEEEDVQVGALAAVRPTTENPLRTGWK
jgi:hypothetical protein